MRTLKNYEKKSRGTPSFPCMLYHVDKKHSEYVMPFHWHSEYELIYVHNGVLNLTADENVYRLERGDVAFLSDGVLHGGMPEGERCVYDCIVFSAELITKNLLRGETADIFRHSKEINQHIVFSHYPTVCETAKRLCESLTSGECEGAELISLGIFTEFFGEVIKNNALYSGGHASDRNIKRLKTLLSYIDEHYGEKITLGELSEVAGVSSKYLCRNFYSLTGKTPMAYIAQYRAERAAEMLKERKMPLSEIAVACGFGDQSYFVKQFKKFTGKTPKEYRAENAQ